MKNLFLDDRRRRQKWPTSTYVEQDHGSSRFTKPEQVDRLVLKELKGAIARLPATQRDVLMGVVAEGWSYEEAAERLDVAIGTVRSRLFRARSALMEMLDPGAVEKVIKLDKAEKAAGREVVVEAVA